MATEDLKFSEWERSKISNQDANLLKKLGFMKKEKTLIFPGEESFPTPRIGYRITFVDHLIRGLATPIDEFLLGLLFVYGLQLHQLTPNSILHISIFITLCECFLGTRPNWGPWKRIFLLRRNSSHNTAYNVGGVVICVRPNVEYFDVKFPGSVQGWRKRWLYIREEDVDSQEYNVVPFDGSEKILRRRSWDAEATDEEKIATETLMKRIHELQNTRGKELSGIQITAYFLRIRVQSLQARKNPLWMYAGDKDMDRLSKDLSVKDLEKLVRKISSLSKKDTIPTSCRVEPYSGTNVLRKKHQIVSSLPPLPEGGEVEERTVVTDDTQGTSRPESEVAGSHKSAASSERETASEASESAHSLPSAVSPRNKRKRGDVEDSGASKPNISPAEETAPEEEDAFCPYEDAIVSSESSSRRPLLLEIHGDLARRTIVDAKNAFTRLFPYFFPKKDQPNTFAALTKYFIPEEDLGLALRQENLKIGVEGTIALVVESQQNVDWAKAGDTKRMKTEKWQSFIRAAKPHSKKILSFLGYKPAPSSSSAKPELVFYNYTATPRSSDALPASSYSKKASVDNFTEDSSNASLSQELNDLRQQLQSMKKRAIMIMDRFRKSSEREKVALQEAKEALALRDTAVAEAAQAVSREEYMLDLLTDASLDMAGSFLDAAAEDQRVDARGVDKINDIVTPVAEEMIDDLLRMDADFFMDGHYADFMGATAEEERINVDDIMGME
ncbi:hypothetical protein QYE76_066482 [Lolium multiflorum]|uniref:Transposase (putative) gypsy type domain-containing protein n=1 Tax=Lolium multiflorum TaxID=4521 RepID=A0AAD8WC53_LOLMU|nr:hypothetical protein QYE76_066482 [Lolium multiflorum]